MPDDFDDMIKNAFGEGVDFDGTEESSGFEPLPAGIFTAEIDAAEFGKSRNGNPMVTVTFRVIDEPYHGRLLWEHFVTTSEVAKSRLKKMLHVATGESPSKFTPDDIPEVITKRLRLRVTPRNDAFGGNKITDFMPPEDEFEL
jgi:hypothetical protein